VIAGPEVCSTVVYFRPSYTNDLSGGILQKSRPTQHKRARERARLEKQQQKAARRQEHKKTRADRPAGQGTEDPDIAGIVPGPQPSPWEDE
jgi:hypothetical protein